VGKNDPCVVGIRLARKRDMQNGTARTVDRKEKEEGKGVVARKSEGAKTN